MLTPVTVLRTKITPPRPGPRTLERPRVTCLLAEALNYRLTLVQAGAGFGKTTALAGLAGLGRPLIWYQAMPEDRDPLVFLLHLCHASRLALPELSDLPISLLESWEGASSPLPSTFIFNHILDEWLNSFAAVPAGPILLVLDDVHLVASSPEIAGLLDRLVNLAPPDLHTVLAGRPPLNLPGLAGWRARGLVLPVERSALAFTAEEIAALFARAYDYELTADEAVRLFEATEGWAIALQLVWQSLRSGAFASVEEVLSNQASSLDSLFHLLATETYAGQPADVQAFLQATSILRVITPEACDALGIGNSAVMLAYLRRIDLFLVDLGDGSLRYHHIFHSFLEQLADPTAQRMTHLLAAAYFQTTANDPGEALYHLQEAGDIEAMAALLDAYGGQLLASGRLDTLAGHLANVPPEVLGGHPPLLFYLGELARLRSRFQEALGWYQQAETVWREHGQMEGVGRALRGQARVYLDTVNPSQAEALLEQSIRLSEGAEGHEMRARLYELLAENKLNAGHIEAAESLRQQAEALRSASPSDSQLLYRVLLRTGRLDEAAHRLEERAAAEQLAPVLTPRAHRETHLLLSLVYALQGRGEDAYTCAREGGRRGVDLRSPFVTAVGHMRVAHALCLLPDANRREQARAEYEAAIAISRELAVPRLIVEASWGLCRVYGYAGDLVRAEAAATQGIDIATAAGDEWIASLVRVSMGAGLALAGRYEAALEWLTRALQGFQECSDAFGACAARLWLATVRRQQGKHDLLTQLLPAALAAGEDNGYDYLLTRPTFLGPPDERVFTPLLILARARGWRGEYAGRLLATLGLAEATHHPGYRVRVTTLGGFMAYRGDTAIAANSWRRAKARQLFQLLLTYRRAGLDRDQILEYLWPGMEPAAAGRNFKVTLNTLYQVLEPHRPPGADSAFVHREGTSYCLRAGADLWLDAERFTGLVAEARAARRGSPVRATALLEEAVALYKGDYLPDALYETWAAAERERLAVMFLGAADQLAELYLDSRRFEQAVEVAHRLLAADNCWERAYRHLMLAYNRLGNRGQIARTYQRCVQTLREELDVAPTEETTALYAELTG